MTSQKYTILYARLSQEDSRAGDSNSIINQREMLEKYAKNNGFENTMFLSDDGFSGTNFDRPSWKRIEAMIELDQVETLIVKDLSRLGREYLKVGYYTELYFPTKGVRFIAVNDSVDSLVESSNDFNPIRNWANELHAKEASKKVRAVKRLQAERGERHGGRIPYGYKKSEGDSKQIVPNEETAPIVKRIFALCAAGKGPGQIATILRKEEIMTPSYYYFQKYGKVHRFLDHNHPYAWSSTTVGMILGDMTYLGHTAGQRSTTVSYKNQTVIKRPEDEWIIIKNTHEALVTQEQWDIVRDVRKRRHYTPVPMEAPNVFYGMVYCMDCGKPLTIHRSRSMKESSYYLSCYTYSKRGKTECSAHHIRIVDLEAIVLDDLRRVTHFARLKERQFAEHINQRNSVEINREMNALNRELGVMRKRKTELTVLFKRLYEDNVLGRITNEQFRILSDGYNTEQKELEETVSRKEQRLETLKSMAANTDAFVEKAKRYKTIDKLTPEILRLFIQRIEVGERSERYSRICEQRIRIIYRDIGFWDETMIEAEKWTKETPDSAVPENVTA